MSKLQDWVDRRQCYPDSEDFFIGQDLLDFARETRGNTVLLSFSRGIDSLATWLYLRENNFEIIPYWLWHIPGLQFQERELTYYEEFFGTPIYRLPCPQAYRWFNGGVWMPPHQLATILALDLPLYDYGSIDNLVAADAGLIEGDDYTSKPWCAMGIRRTENLFRMTLVDQGGVMGSKYRMFFYPIWDWRIADVSEIIKRYKVKISVEYEMFGQTTDAMWYCRFAQIRDRFPEDWERVLQWFPLVEAEMFRYEKISYEKA